MSENENAQQALLDTDQVAEATAAESETLSVETMTYADGVEATGTAPLPEESPASDIVTLDEGKQILADRPEVSSVQTDQGILHRDGSLAV